MCRRDPAVRRHGARRRRQAPDRCHPRRDRRRPDPAPLGQVASAGDGPTRHPRTARRPPSGRTRTPQPAAEVAGEIVTAAECREILEQLDMLGVRAAPAGGCVQVAIGDPITGRLIAVATRNELRRGSGSRRRRRTRRGTDNPQARPRRHDTGQRRRRTRPATARADHPRIGRPRTSAASSGPATATAGCPAAAARPVAATSTTASPTPTAARPTAGTSAASAGATTGSRPSPATGTSSCSPTAADRPHPERRLPRAPAARLVRRARTRSTVARRGSTARPVALLSRCHAQPIVSRCPRGAPARTSNRAAMPPGRRPPREEWWHVRPFHHRSRKPAGHGRRDRLRPRQVMPAVRQMDGCVGLSMLADRESGRCIVTTAWADADAMHRSAEGVMAMRQRAAEIMGGPADVQEWEIAVLHRLHEAHYGACARVIWTRATPLDRPDDRRFRMTLIPRVEELPGFCSVSVMIDRESGRLRHARDLRRPRVHGGRGPRNAAHGRAAAEFTRADGPGGHRGRRVRRGSRPPAAYRPRAIREVRVDGAGPGRPAITGPVTPPCSGRQFRAEGAVRPPASAPARDRPPRRRAARRPAPATTRARCRPRPPRPQPPGQVVQLVLLREPDRPVHLVRQPGDHLDRRPARAFAAAAASTKSSIPGRAPGRRRRSAPSPRSPRRPSRRAPSGSPGTCPADGRTGAAPPRTAPSTPAPAPEPRPAAPPAPARTAPARRLRLRHGQQRPARRRGVEHQRAARLTGQVERVGRLEPGRVDQGQHERRRAPPGRAPGARRATHHPGPRHVGHRPGQRESARAVTVVDRVHPHRVGDRERQRLLRRRRARSAASSAGPATSSCSATGTAAGPAARCARSPRRRRAHRRSPGLLGQPDAGPVPPRRAPPQARRPSAASSVRANGSKPLRMSRTVSTTRSWSLIAGPARAPRSPAGSRSSRHAACSPARAAAPRPAPCPAGRRVQGRRHVDHPPDLLDHVPLERRPTSLTSAAGMSGSSPRSSAAAIRSDICRSASSPGRQPAQGRQRRAGRPSRQLDEQTRRQVDMSTGTAPARPLEGQLGGHLVPAVALLAQQHVAGDDDVLEHDLVEVVAAVEDADRVDGDARQRQVDQQLARARVPVPPSPRRGAHQHDRVVRVVGVRRPHLGAVDHPVAVGVPGRLRADRGEVGAGVRLAHPDDEEALARGDARQDLLALLLGAVAQQVRPGLAVGDPVRGHRRPAASSSSVTA